MVPDVDLVSLLLTFNRYLSSGQVSPNFIKETTKIRKTSVIETPEHWK